MAILNRLVGCLCPHRIAGAPRKPARFEWFIVLVAFWFAGQSRAYAYLDPGTGNVLLQAALSVFVGALIWARHSISRMGELFKRSNRRSPDDDHRDVQD